MRRRRSLGHGGLAALVGALLVLSLGGLSGPADAHLVQYCSQIPIVHGTPPWGFHTGAPISGATGRYARGHGDINLATGSVSGVFCEVFRVRHQPDRLIVLSAGPRLIYHAHGAVMWGYPGNEIKVPVRVKRSFDPRCKVGTRGRLIVFGSYNGVRSDSVQFIFPAACRDHNHLYHGPQVNVQVPPA